MTDQLEKPWIGRKIDVLDKGYVLVVDTWGADEDVCAAARVSYAEGCKQVKDDAALIDYMMRHGHTSPFEQAFLKLEIKLPIVVEREWARTRTASWNEMSGRYSVLPEEFYVPTLDRVRRQSTTNRQGSGEEVLTKYAGHCIDHAASIGDWAFKFYNEDLAAGVAREVARFPLPLSTYTKKVWTLDLHNLLHFLKLRTSPAAMWEIRQYAEAIEEVVSEAWPLTYASWRNHVKDAVTFSADELPVVWEAIEAFSAGARLEDPFGCPPLTGSRLREFAAKMKRVGLPPTGGPKGPGRT